MAAKTNIEWTDATWNPTTGCSKVSSGCKNCYAERMSKRLRGRCGYPADDPFRVTLHPERLEQPFRWKKPRRVFVDSMGDLFHEDVPLDFIAAVFGAMAACPQHTFQILTKRPERMKDFFMLLPEPGSTPSLDCAANLLAYEMDIYPNGDGPIHCKWGPSPESPWPLSNVWLGVTAENQKTADERIPKLLECPAAVRFVSCEPLLEPVDLGLLRPVVGGSLWVRLKKVVRADFPFSFLLPPEERQNCYAEPGIYRANTNPNGALSVVDKNGEILGIKPDEFEQLPSPDWIIVGGETGPGARQMHIDWARSLIRQCKSATVPCFVKQLGANSVYDATCVMPEQPDNIDPADIAEWANAWANKPIHLTDRRGKNQSEWPDDLRGREFPEEGV